MNILDALLVEAKTQAGIRPETFTRKIPFKPPEKIYFDADLFRWWFDTGCRLPELQGEYHLGVTRGWSRTTWRNWMRGHIKRLEREQAT